MTEQDQVLVHGKPLKARNHGGRIWRTIKLWVLPAPLSLDVKGNIIDAMGYPERIFPIGRLDKESEGPDLSDQRR